MERYMSQFGEMFKRIMTEQGYSVSSFSKLTTLDRGWLYAIFSGKRKLPEPNLQSILNGNFFTQESSERLRQAYYEEIYGKEQMQRILFLQQHFSGFRNSEKSAKPHLPLMAVDLPKSGYCNSQPELYGTAYRIIQEVKQNPDIPKEIYTNLPYHFSKLDDLLFHTLQDHNPPYTLYRMILLLQNGSSTYNLEALFSSLRYVGRSAHLFCYYAAQQNRQLLDQVFPYYLITPKSVLLIHKNGEQGLLIQEEGFCSKMQESFLAASKRCTEMTYSYSNGLAFLSNSHELRSVNYTLELGNTMTMLLNEELLQRYGSPRFTGISRSGLISSLLGFLQQQSNSSAENFMLLSKQNVIDFLNTGTFPNIPTDYLNPLSLEDRLELLHRLEKHFSNHPHQSLGILEERIFGEYHNEYSISLSQQNSSVIICGQKPHRTGQSFVGECGLQISNAVLYHDFECFFDYAKRNHYIYDSKNSLAILRELALGYGQKEVFSAPQPQMQPAAEKTPPTPSGEKLPAL